MKTILENDSEYVCNIQAPCFQKLNTEEVELIRSSKTQVLFRKGENLTKQGAFATYVLFIVSGIAKQHIEGDGTKSYSLRMVTPGEFVGLSSVFTKNTYSYSTVALTDVQAFLIENSSIMKVSRSNGEFAVNIIKRYCGQNSILFDTIRTLMYKQMNGRMAETLLYLNSIRVENIEVFGLLTRKDIAEFAGISTENAVKILKSFEKDKIVALDDKNITILKHEALEEISRHG
ncbi:Crp/Fnr family transcriptional regulator [uncultured Acetobacteroides sp.]|uniref:Crp/Fnr family transcriptional regulator n=1 Tax=uncultured Acetobacteroides sp. TaxID=1760811 RepID=UPI0029F47C62|nr:Crp/Fnr family transcriptional regulator [uncultured Acetobacteroides sp.]